jgi:hypothetical protein
MTDEEIYSAIHKTVDEAIDQIVMDEKEFISTLRRDIAEEFIIIKNLKKRMDEIESMIHAHAVGVQNVYAKVEKIEKTLELKDIKKLIRYIESYDSQRIKKEIEEIHKYMNSDRIVNAIEEFQEFKDNLTKLLSLKLARDRKK